MKVILLKDVKKQGKKDDIIEVSDGYARNFLIPNKLAVEVNKTTMRDFEAKKEEEKHQDLLAQEEAKALAKRLDNIRLTFDVASNEAGKVNGGISTKQICDALEKDHGIVLDKRKIKDTKVLATLGLSKVKIDLYKGILGTIQVELVEK